MGAQAAPHVPDASSAYASSSVFLHLVHISAPETVSKLHVSQPVWHATHIGFPSASRLAPKPSMQSHEVPNSFTTAFAWHARQTRSDVIWHAACSYSVG